MNTHVQFSSFTKTLSAKSTTRSDYPDLKEALPGQSSLRDSFFEMFVNKLNDTHVFKTNDYHQSGTAQNHETEFRIDSDESRKFETAADSSHELRANSEKLSNDNENSQPSVKNKKDENSSEEPVSTKSKKDSQDDTAIEEIADKLSASISRLLQTFKKANNKSPQKAENGNLEKLLSDARQLCEKMPRDSASSKKLSAIISQLEKNLSAIDGRSQKNSFENNLQKLLAVTEQIQKEKPEKTTLVHLADNRHIQKNADIPKTDSEFILNSQQASKKEFIPDQNGSGSDFSFSRNNSLRDSTNVSGTHHRHEAKHVFRDQLDNLINSAKVTVQDAKNASISLRMYPEKLGTVTVNLGLENGTVSGRFLVDSNEAKETLLGALNDIKTLLENEGIALGSFQVNVRNGKEHNHNFEQFSEIPRIHTEAAEVSEEYSSVQRIVHDGNLDLVG